MDRGDSMLSFAVFSLPKHTVFHFQICHPKTSVFDVHIFCMYEGVHCPANMYRAFNHFITNFTKMTEPDFQLVGR